MNRIKRLSGFTLIEILIGVALVAIIAVVVLLLLNPAAQRKKIYDTQRKRDLNQLNGLFEQFYLENTRYPTAGEVCFDDPVQTNGVCSCHICGLTEDAGTFSALVNKLYCDPEHPLQEYLYEYDCASSAPNWYKVFAKLAKNPSGGAGGNNSCNFGLSNQSDLEPYPDECSMPDGSPKPTKKPKPTKTPAPTQSGSSQPTNGQQAPSPTPYPACPNSGIHCIYEGFCNICGDPQNCQKVESCSQPAQFFSNNTCNSRCTLSGGGQQNTPTPSPTSFPAGNCPPNPTPKYCKSGSDCNICGDFDNCHNTCGQNSQLYTNPTCNGACTE